MEMRLEILKAPNQVVFDIFGIEDMAAALCGYPQQPSEAFSAINAMSRYPGARKAQFDVELT